MRVDLDFGELRETIEGLNRITKLKQHVLRELRSRCPHDGVVLCKERPAEAICLVCGLKENSPFRTLGQYQPHIIDKLLFEQFSLNPDELLDARTLSLILKG